MAYETVLSNWKTLRNVVYNGNGMKFFDDIKSHIENLGNGSYILGFNRSGDDAAGHAINVVRERGETHFFDLTGCKLSSDFLQGNHIDDLESVTIMRSTSN